MNLPTAPAFSVPVLLLGFNRPDKIRRVVAQLREVRPSRVFVAVDGPRSDRPGEAALCQETQQAAASGIDWPCEVQTLYRDHNLGCRLAISGAITWAFEMVDELIIVEDDCLIDPSFFDFSRVLLERHKDDARIGCISAVNFQQGQTRGDGGYYASKHPHCWGWATWKRAWAHYEDDLPKLRAFMDSKAFEAWHKSEIERAYWRHILTFCETGKVNSWAYLWTFSCWLHNAVTLLPNANLVTNIGFGDDSTHTTADDRMPERPLERLTNFTAPSSLAVDEAADQFTFEHVFCPPCSNQERGLMQQLLKQSKETIKLLKKESSAADQDRRLIEWLRKHPLKAAWRVLRGKLPKF
jgi:hypothetical protein